MAFATIHDDFGKNPKGGPEDSFALVERRDHVKDRTLKDGAVSR